MKPMLRLLLPLALLLGACGSDKGYKIECTVEGLGDRGLEMLRTDGSTLGRHPLHPGKDGKVVIEGEAPRPVFLELFPMDGGEPLASLVVRDGDRIKLYVDPARGLGSLKVSGNNQAMNEYAAWIAGADSLLRAATPEQANRLITDFVDTHRGSEGAAMAVATLYRTRGHELQADSVFNLISTEARGPWATAIFGSALGRLTADIDRSPRGFSFPVGVTPDVSYSTNLQRYALLLFSDRPKSAAALRLLKALHKEFKESEVRLIEIGMETDSAVWRANLGADTALWKQAWAPGGPSAMQIRTFTIPEAPFVIVADSTGRVVYRGTDIAEADSLVRAGLGAGSRTDADLEEEKKDEDKAETPAPEPAAKPVAPSPDNSKAMQLKRADSDKTIKVK